MMSSKFFGKILPPTLLSRKTLATRNAFSTMLDAPASMIALIQIKKYGKTVGLGSGALIDRDVILTAKHIFKNSEFRTGKDVCVTAVGYDTLLHKTKAEKIISIVDHPSEDTDLCVIHIGSKKSAWFKMDGRFPDKPVTIAGYGHTYRDGGMHCSYGTAELSPSLEAELRYSLNTDLGDSGAPLYIEQDGVYKLVGVHVVGSGSGSPAGNIGVFTSAQVLSDIGEMVAEAKTR